MTIVGLLFLSINLFAMDTTVVEGVRINENKIEPSRTAAVITIDNSLKTKNKTVADVLRNVPGLDVVRQGGVGQTTSIFIRGARSEDTLVLIDGIEANDAMSPAYGFDFSSMTIGNIDRIEIYRGPQSVRFGAGALGGVVNVVTKGGANRSISNYLIEGGSYQTDRQAISYRGRADIVSYSIGIDRYSTQGYSAAADKNRNLEPDGARVYSAATKLGWSLGATANVQATVRYAEANVDIDSGGGPTNEDPNNTTKSKQLVTGVSASDRFFDERMKSTLGIYFSEVDRKGKNEPNFGSIIDSYDHFLGENRKIQLENEFAFNDYSTVRVGFQWREESGIAHSLFNGFASNVERKNQSVTGESATYLFETATWFFDVGVRSDQSSQVSNVSSTRASIGKKNSEADIKAFASYGTGFKLPSLYQVYSTYGDQNLKQESSHSIEATLEKKIAESTIVSLTAFENKYTNLIDYNTNTNRYFNLSKASSHGFEVQASSDVLTSLSFRASYTYLESKDETTNLKLLRRPQNAWTSLATYKAGDCEFSAQYIFRGDRDDIDPSTFKRVKNSSYELVNVTASYQLSTWLKAHARIENIFDKKYEDVVGYGTAAASAYAGISGDF